jgi:hypothetical protein
MAVGVNVLETNGKLTVTASISATVQVPATQPAATLVLETPAGAEMEAVLVIWVCASAICGVSAESKKPTTNANALKALRAKTRQKYTRL